MPTGIEETIAALAAAVVAAAADAPFVAPPDPSQSTDAAADAGNFGVEQCLPTGDNQDGDMPQSVEPGAAEANPSTAPVTGDHQPLPPQSQRVDFGPLFIQGNPPAANPPPTQTAPQDTPPTPAVEL